MLAERAATWPRQWMAEGYQTGLRDSLTELLEQKFGTVDSRYAELIAEAPEEQLKLWLKRILSASAAADLFKS